MLGMDFLAAGSMITPLEGDERVYRRERLGVMRRDSHLTTAGKVADGVGDHAALRGHHRRPWYLLHMHERGRPKVPRGERRGNLPQVIPDLRNADGVVRRALELDAATIHERIESVYGRGLVDAHATRVGPA